MTALGTEPSPDGCLRAARGARLDQGAPTGGAKAGSGIGVDPT
jgi:hypothetical protein